jgi:hypothetical protein
MTGEPRYVGVGDEFEEDDWLPNSNRGRPKWTRPQSNIERRMLRAIHPSKKFYNEKDRKAREHAIMIAKAAVSLDTGIVSDYPSEWIEECCQVAEKMRKEKKFIQLKGLITLINNKERRDKFVATYTPKTRSNVKRKLYFNVEDDDESEGI